MILWLNCALAATAAAVNLAMAARVTAFARHIRVMRGVLAGAIATIYGLDLAHVLTFTEGVAWVRSFGLAAWPIVWILPALWRPAVPRPEEIVAEVKRRIDEEGL